MVKTAISKHAKINRDKLVNALSIFGRNNLVHRVVTRTLDTFGQMSAANSTTDVTFTGDLQFGPDLDQRYLTTGIVEVGDGVLYLHPTELSTLPVLRDQIVDGNAVWEIASQIESPELGGTIAFYAFRCKRRVNVSDV